MQVAKAVLFPVPRTRHADDRRLAQRLPDGSTPTTFLDCSTHSASPTTI